MLLWCEPQQADSHPCDKMVQETKKGWICSQSGTVLTHLTSLQCGSKTQLFPYAGSIWQEAASRCGWLCYTMIYPKANPPVAASWLLKKVHKKGHLCYHLKPINVAADWTKTEVLRSNRGKPRKRKERIRRWDFPRDLIGLSTYCV